MITRMCRLVLAVVLTVVALASCSSGKTPAPTPTPPRTPVDYQVLETAIENKIAGGSVAAVTLRQLTTMTGGFPGVDPPYETVKEHLRVAG